MAKAKVGMTREEALKEIEKGLVERKAIKKRKRKPKTSQPPKEKKSPLKLEGADRYKRYRDR